MGNGTSDSFTKSLSSLERETTYYYKAYIRIGTEEYYYGAVKSFTTYPANWIPSGNADAYASSWLSGYEVPATDVNLSSGQLYNDRKEETWGDTYAYIFNPSNSSQTIVTHTFRYNSKEVVNYSMLYDKNKHCALWEAFEMNTTDYPNNQVGRYDSDWAYDPAIPQSWQPNLSNSYSGNYERGHQVASADRQTTAAQNQQTFYYSNMTPQSRALNGGIWLTLEGKVQGLLSNLTSVERVFVVTGPIFEDGYSSTTANGMSCPIPSKYYKCLMKCKFDSSGKFLSAEGAAYLITHESPSRTDTTIDEIERITGFNFFANIPTEYQTPAERESSLTL